ncbi:MAG: phosphoribosylformylglycinamidine synthase [Acidobacteria bacterium]|nr:MAG: phosphoribosylformylglycinamidine synthase [Acidobacteriota bacterium]
MTQIKRIFVEKKTGFDVAAKAMHRDFVQNLQIKELERVRVLQRYDVQGLSRQEFQLARHTVFSEPPVDTLYLDQFPKEEDETVFAIEYLPGQFDQRADSAAQCIQILTRNERPLIQTARVVLLKGALSKEQIHEIKTYCINPVDSREASLEIPETLKPVIGKPEKVKRVQGFAHFSREQCLELLSQLGLAMSIEDLLFCRAYFRDTEKRDPTVTEIKLLDTYWSDHCRHTTFLTRLDEIEIEEASTTRQLKAAFQSYLASRKKVYRERDKDICLMDIATLAMKELRKDGLLDDLEVSEEINACSIEVAVDVNGKTEPWLVMFKNETHNHPTEIEPFGGAATCLGGAIRDPLSGRSYVYQAMRVTGCGDPRQDVHDTLPGKLPQRKITLEAAHGYSSYGNQIGLATGGVHEIYHPGYVAKRMEVGAVIAATPKGNVFRGVPEPGDAVILVGGRTGRDGVGGATGSSKEHTEKALENCSEVQKGDPPTERKLQRLFRNPEVARMIKRCNDFGAGGVSVAIGELTDGLTIDLDRLPLKYEGLDGTELALSESQERMAVVIDAHKSERFAELALRENLEATHVADVTNSRRLVMNWRGETIVDLSRAFLDTNGVKQNARVRVKAPSEQPEWFKPAVLQGDLAKAWIKNLQRLNVCSQRGLVEQFDSTIGAGSVNHPFGGTYQSTPIECMAAKIPVLKGDTETVTLMSHGFNPEIGSWSPFHGGFLAVVESIARLTASGGDVSRVRLTLQEYFEKLGVDPEKWGKPFSAVLGAFEVQKTLGIPAIGGKDSMSGTFKHLHVPPTLVSFAVVPAKAKEVLSPEFKKAGSGVYRLVLKRNQQGLPDLDHLKRQYRAFHKLVQQGYILSAHSIRVGGMAEALSKMCFGNRIGFNLSSHMKHDQLFVPFYGDIVFEAERELEELDAELLGCTSEEPVIQLHQESISLQEIQKHWEQPLESVFRTKTSAKAGAPNQFYETSAVKNRTGSSIAKPRVFIPVFPGTNCEYDSARAFERAGGTVDTFVFRNLSPAEIEYSLQTMAKAIGNSQILMIPGGFSAGDEPEGSGKFIASVFRNPIVSDAVMELLQKRDGLVLGICNGFQALVKLGLLPYGEIRDIRGEDPTLTFNQIGRHVSDYVRTKVVSNLSPWLVNCQLGEIHTLPVSNGEGRFVAPDHVLQELLDRGQVITQYVNQKGIPTVERPFNPSNSMAAIEGISSPDGRVFGKMAHSERMGSYVGANIAGLKDQKLFESGVNYFR